MKVLFAGVLSLFALALVISSSEGVGDKAKPKYTIREVMKKAHGKGGLLAKVKAGTATAAEKKELVEMYAALHANKPPRDEKSAWAKVTQSMVDAAKAVAEGKDEQASGKLAKLVNCMNCHQAFKKAEE